MPEIKHDFSAGKMNKDLDERIVPNGQYRDAMNVQVRTTGSEGGGVGNAGCIQNIPGNKVVTQSLDIHYDAVWNAGPNFDETTFIGGVANEKNNNAYFLISSPSFDFAEKDALDMLINNQLTGNEPRMLFIDYIVEVNTGESDAEPSCKPVVVDKYGLIDFSPRVVPWNVGSGQVQEVQDNWTTLSVTQETADDLRVGMVMQAYDENTTPLIKSTNIVDFDENNDPVEGVSWGAEIMKINQGSGYNTISVYTSCDEVDWEDAVFYTFKHKERVLNFNTDTIVTGINIIEDLLFWTDGQDEPKRINIKKCKSGTPNFTTHTKLRLSDPNDDSILLDYTDIEQSLSSTINNDLQKENITVIKKAPHQAPIIDMSITDRVGEVAVISNNNNLGIVFDFATYTGDNQEIPLGTTFQLPRQEDIEAYTADPFTVVSNMTLNNPVTMFQNTDFRVNDIVTFREQTYDDDSWLTAIIDDVQLVETDTFSYTTISFRVLTINQQLTPTVFQDDVPTVLGSGMWDIELMQKDPMFELVFGRFSTRYKYEDGEYSSYGPWSEIAFIPGPFDFNHKKGYNLGMTNRIRKLVIKDFIPHQRNRPADVVSVDVLWKTTTGPNVYVVKSITRGRDPEWDNFTINDENSTLSFGEMEITSEMIRRPLPNNQNLRSWDNVPITAKAQEIAANRLVFSNYTQGYEIINKPKLKQNLKNYGVGQGGPSLISPKKSMKSIRDYKIGMVFGDKYGRETPIIAPGYLEEKHHGRWGLVDGNVKVPKSFSIYKNTLEVQQLWGDEMSGIPDNWISYVKYFIKETSNEYYNLVMDRWYEAEDGNIWISFASADRNKVDEDTYLILKNEHGTDQAVIEPAKYKIIAIENEAPDFIKQQIRNMGEVTLGNFTTVTDLGSDPNWEEFMWDGSPDPLNLPPQQLMSGTEIGIRADKWNGFLDNYQEKGDLQVRLKCINSEGVFYSPDWRLVTYNHKVDLPDPEDDPENLNGTGAVRWDEPFNATDMFVQLQAASGVEAGQSLPSIRWAMEFRELITKSQPEFEGKFFCKIEKDQILSAAVLSTTAIQTSYTAARNYAIAYIENTEYNPAAIDPIYPGQRRTYKWLNQPGLVHYGGDYDGSWSIPDNTNTENMESYGDFEDFNGELLAVNAEKNGGDDVSASNRVADVKPLWDGGTSSVMNHGGYRGSGGWGPRCGNSHTVGCHPYDAEYLALGCFDTESYHDNDYGTGNPGYNSATQGGLYGQDRNQNIYNRTIETADFWGWYGDYCIEGANEYSHDAVAFIDGARARHVKFSNSPNVNGYGIRETSDGEIVGEYPSDYYKPTGLDPGILTNTDGMGGPPDTFGATDSELGRMVISTLGEFTGAALELKQDLETYGTLFRFQDDPNGKIYKVISSPGYGTTVMMDMKNHSQAGDTLQGEGVNFAAGVAVGCLWSNSPQYNNANSSVSVQGENHLYSDGVYSGVGYDGFNGWGNNGSNDAYTTISFTNRNPRNDWQTYFPSDSSGFTDPDGDGPDWAQDGLVRAGGILNDNEGYNGGPSNQNPALHSSCHPCGMVDFSMAVPGDHSQWGVLFDNNGLSENGYGPAEYLDGYGVGSGKQGGPHCQRNGIRVEFREYDIVNETLVDNGTKGIDTSIWDPRGEICHDGREAMRISIIESTVSGGEIYIPPADPAIFETEPKEDVGLDIYYEASNAIPVKLTSENTPRFAPYGSTVGLRQWNNATPGYVDIQPSNGDWNLNNKNVHVGYIGYTKNHSIVGLKVQKQYSSNLDDDSDVDSIEVGEVGYLNQYVDIGDFLVFQHPDGTKTMSRVLAYMQPIDDDDSNMSSSTLIGVNSVEYGIDYPYINHLEERRFRESSTNKGFYKIDSDVWKFPVELSWFNCYSFGNGVESDRIRDDFNTPTIDNGVKVSSTLLGYGRETMASMMIYSGIYNSTSSTNNLNEFNMAEKITKEINPAYGSIQRLKTRNTDMVVLTEDKALRVVTNKDALYNADGNPQLIASNRVLGTAVPFAGDYGISKNPESLAWDQFRLYFTDKQRGAVLRLSMDGLTPISDVGMKTFFREHLRKTKTAIGTFDVVNGEYNLTLNPGNNNMQPLTASFNEESKGWVSFKSFIPQVGVSVGGKYLTSISKDVKSETKNKVGIYQHYIDIKKSDPTALNYNEIINKNVFYAPNEKIEDEDVDEYFEPSSFTVLFNDMPEVVKAFRAVNYDGSQAKVNQFTSEQASDSLFYSDGEYYNLTPEEGWWVDNIKTDLSNEGDVQDFEKKEGKWFQKIGGGDRAFGNDDLSEFSVQGLGQAIAEPDLSTDTNGDGSGDGSGDDSGDGDEVGGINWVDNQQDMQIQLIDNPNDPQEGSPGNQQG